MTLRDKMRTRCQALLGEGERIDEVAFAQSSVGVFVVPAVMIVALVPMFTLRSFGLPVVVGGVSLAFGTGLILMVSVARFRILCWTDRSLVVFKSSAWSASPNALLERLPRETNIGPLNGLWASVRIGNETVLIHRRFHGDVDAAESFR